MVCVLSALVVFELSALVWCWCLYGCSGGVCIEWIGVVMVYSGAVLLCIVCHWCSAGVGRTGTLIGIDMAITQAPTDGVVDIPSIVTKLRRQRMKMVQTAVSVMKLY